jgi:N-acetylneuraminic acid mutarotase
MKGTPGKFLSSLAVGFLASSLLGLCAVPVHAFVPQWESAGEMDVARRACTATVLPDGRALVAGGYNGSTPYSFYSSAELYDPATGTWESTDSMEFSRAGHRAVLLPNGKVLVAGGYDGAYLTSAELYDPGTGTWTTTGSMAEGRVWHTMTLLPNGKVLVTGGEGTTFGILTAELYDPAANGGLGAWSPTGSMAQARVVHTATLLPDGRVLVAGGLWYIPSIGYATIGSAELYDPAAGTWSPTGTMADRRHWHTATLLPNGKVLVAGGQIYGISGVTTGQLYDPEAGTWSFTGNMSAGRAEHTATLLPNGYVMVAGGIGNGVNFSAERYDPVAGTWSSAGTMADNRFEHSAPLLHNGRVLVVGGYSGSAPRSSAELYAPVSDGPFLGSFARDFAKPGAVVTIRGYNFEATQGDSTVTFNGVDAGLAASWNDGEIKIKVPPGAGSGPVAVTVGGATSNALSFQVIQGCDFDGDGRTDVTIWRPSTGYWFTLRSSDGSSTATECGAAGDIPAPGDYDGDGKTDIASYYDGYWYIILSADNTVRTVEYGGPGDMPVPGDYDGDGKTDIAIYRAAYGYWFIVRSSDGATQAAAYGEPSMNDAPIPGDYDGDGKTDIAIYRSLYGYWFVLRSSDGATDAAAYGEPSMNDQPMPGDYDGDGKTDFAIYRAVYGYWFIKRSSDGGTDAAAYGEPSLNDAPVPGDYDGDGKTDIAIYRPVYGYWFIKRSMDETTQATEFGSQAMGDEPVKSRY